MSTQVHISDISTDLQPDGKVLAVLNGELAYVDADTAGAPGKSAYELAVEAGYAGSLPDWLVSLKAASYYVEGDFTATSDDALEARFIAANNRIFATFGIPAVLVRVTGVERDPTNPFRHTAPTKSETAITVLKQPKTVKAIDGVEVEVLTVEARQELKQGDFLKFDGKLYTVSSSSPDEIKSTVLTWVALLDGGSPL